MSEYKVDLNRIMMRPLYFGVIMNIFVPGIMAGIVYYLESSGGVAPRLQSENQEIFFWALVAVSVFDCLAAFLLKKRNFFAPMIRSKETFEADLAQGVFRHSLLGYALTTSIAVYGLVFYLVGGTFNNLIFFVFLSFIAFQLTRPRLGFLEKVLAAQEKHVDEGRLLMR